MYVCGCLVASHVAAYRYRMLLRTAMFCRPKVRLDLRANPRFLSEHSTEYVFTPQRYEEVFLRVRCFEQTEGIIFVWRICYAAVANPIGVTVFNVQIAR